MSRKPENINILLVNPWIIDFKAFDLWLKPMGLLYISSILKKNGFNVTLIDCMNRSHPSVAAKKVLRPDMTGKFYNLEIKKPYVYREIPRQYKRYGIPVESFINDLDNSPTPDLILVTSIMTNWYPGVHEAISILKDKYPSAPLILGGIYATLSNDFAVKNSGADIVFSGNNISDFCKIINQILDTKCEFVPESFARFPYPDFSVYGKPDYHCIMTSAGCPFSCTYCASKILHDGFTVKDYKSVIDEIENAVRNSGCSNFAFYDDALLVDAENRIIPILEEVIDRKYNITFHTPNGLHARFINKKTANLMKRSGFYSVRISLETTDPGILASTGNKLEVTDFEEAVANLGKAGFSNDQIFVYILMGIPGQTFDQVEKTIEYSHKMGLQSRLSVFSPVPGTPDYIKTREISKNKFDDPLYHNNTYQYFKGSWLDYDQRKYLKDKVHGLNRRLIQGI